MFKWVYLIGGVFMLFWAWSTYSQFEETTYINKYGTFKEVILINKSYANVPTFDVIFRNKEYHLRVGGIYYDYSEGDTVVLNYEQSRDAFTDPNLQREFDPYLIIFFILIAIVSFYYLWKEMKKGKSLRSWE